MKSILDTREWKIECLKIGTYISYPSLNKEEVIDNWRIGPLDEKVAEWLLDAIEKKQLCEEHDDLD